MEMDISEREGLRADGLSLRYKDTCRVGVDSLSLELPENGLVLLTGPSGCGKSTLLTLIGSFDLPDSGSVSFKGCEITSLRGKGLRDFRREVLGVCFQEANLLPGLTVRENLAPCWRRKDSEMIIEELGLADLLDTPARFLSGGEAERVAVARAILKGSSLILVDEPTASLDGENGAQVAKVLKEASRSALVIVASHDISLFEPFADVLVRLRDGKLVSAERIQDPLPHEVTEADDPPFDIRMEARTLLKDLKRSLPSHPARLVSGLLLSFLSLAACFSSFSLLMRDDGSISKDLALNGSDPALLGKKDGLGRLSRTELPEGSIPFCSLPLSEPCVLTSYFIDEPSLTRSFERLFGVFLDHTIAPYSTSAGNAFPLLAGTAPTSASEALISDTMFRQYQAFGFEHGGIRLSPGSFDIAGFLAAGPELMLSYPVRTSVRIVGVFDDGYGDLFDAFREQCGDSPIEDNSSQYWLLQAAGRGAAGAIFLSEDAFSKASEMPDTFWVGNEERTMLSLWRNQDEFIFTYVQAYPPADSIFPFGVEDGAVLPYDLFLDVYSEVSIGNKGIKDFRSIQIGDSLSDFHEYLPENATVGTLLNGILESGDFEGEEPSEVFYRFAGLYYLDAYGIPDEVELSAYMPDAKREYPDIDFSKDGVLEVYWVFRTVSHYSDYRRIFVDTMIHDFLIDSEPIDLAVAPASRGMARPEWETVDVVAAGYSQNLFNYPGVTYVYPGEQASKAIWERLSQEDVAYFLPPEGEMGDLLAEGIHGNSLMAFSPPLASWQGFVRSTYGTPGLGALIGIIAAFATLVMFLSLVSVLSGSNALMAGEDALRKSLGEGAGRPYLRGFLEASLVTLFGGIPALIAVGIVFAGMNGVAASVFLNSLSYYSLDALAVIGAFVLFLLLSALLALLLLPSGEKKRKAALKNRFR